jgi:pimeloyl-ACP methyl ester carboxylesterase
MISLVLAATTAMLIAGCGSVDSARPPTTTSDARPTVVIVHGVVDASGWNGVVGRLPRAGYPVVAGSNPLRGVGSDANYLRSVLATIATSVVLVGHSYGGMVITNAAAMGATQRPLAKAATVQKSGPPAWRSLPSWYMVAQDDHAIPPAAERFMARRAHAHTVEVRSSHDVMVSHPGAVTKR